MAERTLRAATAPLVLPGIPAGAVDLAATIYLAPSPAVFDSLTGGLAPEWSAGVALPAERLIVLPAYPSSRTPDQDPITALRHELVHVALHEYVGHPVPRWFDEGYAVWASGEWDARSGWEIRFALLRGDAPPLDSLSLRWPGGAARARLAYLLSASAVRYLATRNGEPAFATFLRDWRREGTVDAALRSTYQLTLGHFQQEWRRVVARKYGWILILAQAGSFWALVAVLFVALGLARRRRDRARLAELEREDRMLPPGPPVEAPEPDELGSEDDLPPYLDGGERPE
jgi:hypothetical protein